MNREYFEQQAREAMQNSQTPNGPGFAVIKLGQHNKQFAVWHPTLDAAKQEAERLAASTNQPFAVIQLVGVMEPAQRPVTWKPAAA